MAHFLHVIADLDYGGAQTQLALLAKAARGRGDQVTVASLRRPGPIGDTLLEAGIEVVWLKERFAPDPFVIGRLGALLQRLRPEAVQSWDLAAGWYTRLTHRSCRWLHTVRDLEDSAGRRQGVWRRLLTSATALVVPDEALADSIVHGGAQPSRLAVVPNAVDPADYALDPEAARDWLPERLELPKNSGPLIGVVGRWDQMERGKEVLWAADLVRVLRPGVKLIVVGAGRRLLQCERFARHATEPGVVRFTGPWAAWPKVLAGLDMLWVPNETSLVSTPLLEAVAAKVPVVATQSPGRQRIAEEGVVELTEWDDRAGWVRATERILARDRSTHPRAFAAEEILGGNLIEHVAEVHRALMLGESVECEIVGEPQAEVSP